MIIDCFPHTTTVSFFSKIRMLLSVMCYIVHSHNHRLISSPTTYKSLQWERVSMEIMRPLFTHLGLRLLPIFTSVAWGNKKNFQRIYEPKHSVIMSLLGTKNKSDVFFRSIWDLLKPNVRITWNHDITDRLLHICHCKLYIAFWHVMIWLQLS